MPLSAGSTVPECFVEGLGVVDECKPANGTATSIKALLDAGIGPDSDDGSLCSLTANPSQVRIPFSPA